MSHKADEEEDIFTEEYANELMAKQEPDGHNYYVYYYRKGIGYVYERTCGTEAAAKDRVRALNNYYGYDCAVYLIDHIIKGAFY